MKFETFVSVILYTCLTKRLLRRNELVLF